MDSMLATATEVTPDSIVSWIGWVHGQYPFVGTLLVVMLLDVLSGLSAAFVTKTINSSVSWNGMVRKASMLLLIGLGTALEPYAGEIPLSKLIAVCFTATESISILENLGRAGVPIPEQLYDVLEKLRTPVRKAGKSSSATSVSIMRADNVEVHAEGETRKKSRPDSSVIITGSTGDTGASQ